MRDQAVLDFSALASLQPQFFSVGQLAIDASTVRALDQLIAAIESVIALPAYQARVLADAPQLAQLTPACSGVFYGYDFHLTVDGPRLIEINTNAGGALLNTALLAAQGDPEGAAACRADFLAMFRAEWRQLRGDTPLRRIAIVDDQPHSQFLSPEFVLFQQLFEAAGIGAVIADPAELKQVDGQLCYAGEPIDLVYNRLTDFSLDGEVCRDLREVFAAGGVVLTPHPRAHALYADKRNLMLLSDPAILAELGVPLATQAILLAGIPRTLAVDAAQGDTFWRERKRWFFKPAAGFGSRAAYRGDKLTRRVFEEIMGGGYIAQEIIPPPLLDVPVGETVESMKYDLRCYVYQGRVQLRAARLYQGQTTNFRTPGGGFAPVFLRSAT